MKRPQRKVFDKELRLDLFRRSQPVTRHCHTPKTKMRAANAFLASAVASIAASTATAFLSPLPHAPGSSMVAAFSGQRIKTSRPRVAAVDNAPKETDLPLPPKDETFTPLQAIKELLASPDVVEDAGRYDRVGRLTGGVWRSIIIGFIPSTVRAAYHLQLHTYVCTVFFIPPTE